MPATRSSIILHENVSPFEKAGPGGISAKAWLVILIGLGLRLWVCLHTVIVNPDGALYIHQAMALYFKNWNSLKTCGLTFLSSYPVLDCRRILPGP